MMTGICETSKCNGSKKYKISIDTPENTNALFVCEGCAFNHVKEVNERIIICGDPIRLVINSYKF